MSLYRMISTAFWTDSKVIDDFTPEDRYFYLYLFSNPHTNLCGCYEISVKQMANETGYSLDTIYNLLKRFTQVHKVICYSPDTKEVLLINWHKYNWTKSDKYLKALCKEIEAVKNPEYQDYLSGLVNDDTVSIPYQYPMDTANTNTITNTTANSKAKPQRHKYGEYKNVLLSDADLEKLKTEFPADWEQWIERLSSGIASKGYSYKNHLATIRNWAKRDQEKARKKDRYSDVDEWVRQSKEGIL